MCDRAHLSPPGLLRSPHPCSNEGPTSRQDGKSCGRLRSFQTILPDMFGRLSPCTKTCREHDHLLSEGNAVVLDCVRNTQRFQKCFQPRFHRRDDRALRASQTRKDRLPKEGPVFRGKPLPEPCVARMQRHAKSLRDHQTFMRRRKRSHRVLH